MELICFQKVIVRFGTEYYAPVGDADASAKRFAVLTSQRSAIEGDQRCTQ
jgi:hypothetical protein